MNNPLTNRGMMYLNKPDANYRHLRSMLQKLFVIGYWSDENQFDIDSKFEYNVPAIIAFIRANFGMGDIGIAHERAIQEIKDRESQGYVPRGRPKGARNKPKHIDTHGGTDILDEILPPVKAEPLQIEPPKAPVADNNNDYITRTEYSDNNKTISARFEGHAATMRDLHTRIEVLDDSHFNLRTDVDAIKDELKRTRVISVEVKRIDRAPIDLGRQHYMFPDLLALCLAAIDSHDEPLNVWLYGPAGTGKTTAAKMIAHALSKAYERAFPFYALSKLSTEYQVLGYQDANGKYISTMFRRCYEFGGVIILDEIDSWSPNAMTALNGALANGYCAFPDGMIERHPDCIVIAGANTVGTGGTLEYVGRMKQDAASLDRFEMLHWPIDEALEAALTNNSEWLAAVRHVRAAVIKHGIKDIMITPRAAIKGAARIRAGITVELATELFLKRGLTQEQWAKVKP